VTEGELKTSEEWSEILDITVMDPDGWDRKNFAESWNELITRDEFMKRAIYSTLVPKGWFK